MKQLGWKIAILVYVDAELDLVCVSVRVGTGSQKITTIFPEWKNRKVDRAWALDLAPDKALWY